MSKLVYLILVVASLSGCATSARVDHMVATKVDVSKVSNETPLKNNIWLKNMSGGDSTKPLLLPKVSDSDFKLALEQSLKEAKLLASTQSNGNYTLDVKLISLDHPIFGMEMKATVTATVQYILEEKSTGKRIYFSTIVSPFTATFSDSALGAGRLGIANEGAVRKNIEKLIDELLTLKIPVEQVSLVK